MQSELEWLLEYYDGIISRFRNLMNESKSSGDYEEVILYQKSLQLAHQERDRLLLVKNPNHYKKENDERFHASLLRMQERLKPKLGDFYLQDEIDKFQQRIESHSRINPNKEETQLVDEQLFKLIENQINRFTLVLKGFDTRFDIEIEKPKKLLFTIKLSSENEDSLRGLHENLVLKELQFKFIEKTKLFEAQITLNHKKNVLPIKEFLSRLVYGMNREFEIEPVCYLMNP